MNRRFFLAALTAGLMAPRLVAAPPTVNKWVRGHDMYFASDAEIDGVFPIRTTKDGDSPGFHPSNVENQWRLEILRPWFPDGEFRVRVQFKNGGHQDYSFLCNKAGVFFQAETA